MFVVFSIEPPHVSVSEHRWSCAFVFFHCSVWKWLEPSLNENNKNSRSSVSSFIVSPAVEFLDPNLSQSRHICRKQKTNKAALVDIFLSFKLGSFSVSISRLLCSHISCSSSVWRLISLKIRLGVYFWSNILISWLKVKELFFIRPGGVAEDRTC